MSEATKTDAGKPEAINQFLHDVEAAPPVPAETVVTGIQDILAPPKPEPKGWIDKDNPPEVGTTWVLENETVYHFIQLPQNVKCRAWFVWKSSATVIGAIWLSWDEWNEQIAPYVTAVHPPVKPKKPKIRLIANRLKNVGVGSVHRQYWVAPLDGATPPDAAINGLRTVLEDAGIDVEVIK